MKNQVKPKPPIAVYMARIRDQFGAFDEATALSPDSARAILQERNRHILHPFEIVIYRYVLEEEV